MTSRIRRNALLLLALGAYVALSAAPAAAQLGPPEVDRQVLLFLVDRVSFEEILAVPDIRALARAGGVALMSPRTAAGDDGSGAYLTLGAGARSKGPDPAVLAFDPPEMVEGQAAAYLYQQRYPNRALPIGPFLLDAERYIEANEGRAVPGLLGDVLLDARRLVGVFGNADTTEGRDRPGLLVAMDRRGGAFGRVGTAFVPSPGGGQPLELPLAEPKPDLLGGTRLDYDALIFLALGGRIPNPSPFLRAHLTVFDMGDTLRIDRFAPGASPAVVARERREALIRIGEGIRYFVGRAPSKDVLVIVVSPSTSLGMDRAKDELTPIVMARGDPLDLFPEEGELHTLASDTTRRPGLISNEDVAPTILRFFSLFAPEEMNGSPIRFVTDPAPFELHQRHLANRRMSVPVQAGAGIYVTVAGLFAVAVLALRRWVPAWLGHLAAWFCLTVPALCVALLAAGHLEALRYGTVVPFVVALTVIGTLTFIPLKRWGLLLPPAAIGAAVLVFFAVEARLEWTAAITPFIGGSELDGARFYGMPNVFIGLLIGSSLYVAASLPRVLGFVLVVGVAFFIGLPGTGANLGGALAAFAAAGLWLALRTWGRLSWKGLGIALGVVALGMAAVLAAHAFLTATPTHATAFLEASGGGLSGLVRTGADRLLVGWRLIVRNPFSLVPVLGVPACLLLVLHPPEPMREALARHPKWRDATLVILLASVVAYFTEDSGAAAVGLGFGLALGGLLYVALIEQAWKAPTAEAA